MPQVVLLQTLVPLAVEKPPEDDEDAAAAAADVDDREAAKKAAAAQLRAALLRAAARSGEASLTLRVAKDIILPGDHGTQGVCSGHAAQHTWSSLSAFRLGMLHVRDIGCTKLSALL